MERALVTTHTEAVAELLPYKRTLLSPRPTPPRSGSQYLIQVIDPSQVPQILEAAARSQVLAVDFETRGIDYSEVCTTIDHCHDEQCRSTHIIGVGLAWDTGSAYLPYIEMPHEDSAPILDMISRHQGLIAHNVYFDGGVLLRHTSDYTVHWHACTLALYRLLSNEGWAGITHGLKGAMTEILQWEDSNEAGIDEWLVGHGYYIGNRRLETDYNALVAQYREGKLRPDKGEMWRVPHEILGAYCVLDAEATYLLYTEHLLPVVRKFPTMEENFRNDWMYLIHLHIQQKMVGIRMDRRALVSRQQYLIETMTLLAEEFLARPEVVQHVLDMESEMRVPLAESEPVRHKKLPVQPIEPPQLKKDGTLSKNWEKWKAQVDSGKYTVPTVSKNWENWHQRWTRAVNGLDETYRFNVQSKVQLAELFYRRLGYPVRILTDKEQPGTGSDALAQMGELGQILIRRDDALKELGFIAKYLDLIAHRDTIHPSFGLPGTSTGRLSSRDPNLQQVKKTKAMMDLFVARNGHTWIDLDFHALEPVVTTEFSGDANMEAIYGNIAKPNDIYLFVAYTVPQWRADLDRVGYDPYNPSNESVSAAKKDPITKHIRKIAKVVVLACAYGAGVDKILENLVNDGVQVTRDDVSEVHRGYWELFAGVKQYGYSLQDKWWETVDLPESTKEMYRSWSKSRHKREQIPRNISGYVINGMGRPMCVTHDYKKDTLNRFIQSTGHDILVRYIRLVGEELDRRAIPWDPLIADMHDAMTVEVPDRCIVDTIEVFKDSLDELNRQLGGDIRLRGTPSSGKNLSAVKEPEE